MNEMNRRKAMGTVLLLSALLSGCGAHDAANGSANAASTNTAADQTQQHSDQQQTPGQQRPAMTQQERQMLFMFQALISMDKSDGLSITKDEAQQMLPIVQDAVSKGELTSDQQSKLEAILTADQKKFLDDAAARMQNRMNNRGSNGNGAAGNNGSGSGNGNGNGSGNAGKPPSDQQNSATQGQAPHSGQNGQRPNGAQGNHQGQRRGGNGNGGFQNIGQQLVDLLQAKTK
jgi:hypothetical protein